MVFVGPISLDLQLLFNKEQCRLLIIKTCSLDPLLTKSKLWFFQQSGMDVRVAP